MAGDKLFGDPEFMQQAANKAGIVADQIEVYRTNLQPIVEAARSHWNGTARPVFEQKHEEWQQTINQLIAKLRSIGVNTGHSAASYVSADLEGATGFKAVDSGGAAPFAGQLGGPVATA